MKLKFDIRHLQKLRNQFNSKDVEKALEWALKATTRKTATLISKDIRNTYAIKAGDIKRHLKIKKYRRDATRALLYTGGMIPLEEFKPKTRRVRTTATSSRGKKFVTHRRGVTVKVRKDKGRKLVEGGWLAKGHVLRRTQPSAALGETANTAPPFIMYGPSIPGMVAHPETLERAQDLVREDLPKQFSDRLDYLLSNDK